MNMMMMMVMMMMMMMMKSQVVTMFNMQKAVNVSDCPTRCDYIQFIIFL